MPDRYRLIDSDAHVLEPADMFEKYLEPAFRSPFRIWQRIPRLPIDEPITIGCTTFVPRPEDASLGRRRSISATRSRPRAKHDGALRNLASRPSTSIPFRWVAIDCTTFSMSR